MEFRYAGEFAARAAPVCKHAVKKLTSAETIVTITHYKSILEAEDFR